MKILIAEDDFTSRSMLQAVLTKWDYDVISTSNGNEAYDVFQEKNAPQLAVVDWMMPGMDGLSLCQKLRQQHLENPLYLILLTVKTEKMDIVRGLEEGADDYIVKPFNNEELRARVNVGRRLITMQNKIREWDRFQGVLEMAGAVCHELNQPLQYVLGYSELLQKDMDACKMDHRTIDSIIRGIDRIGNLTNKIMNISSYKSKPYLKYKIVDIEQASNLITKAN